MRILLTFWLTVIFSILAGNVSALILLIEGFEGDLKQWGLEKCCSHSITISSDESREGEQSLKVVQRLTDEGDIGGVGNYRAEVKTTTPMEKGQQYWVGFSVKPNQISNTRTILFQFHQKPDPGQEWGSPPYYLYIENGKFLLRQFVIYDLQDLGEVESDQWTDFVINVKWSTNGQDDGCMKVWRDGELVFTMNGANTYDENVRGQKGPHIKFGAYTGKQPSRTVVYFDQFKFADSNASYTEVSPSNEDNTVEIPSPCI